MGEEKGKDVEVVYKLIGAIHALKMMGNFVDSARYSLYKQAKDHKVYLLLDMDWKEFCRKKLGGDHEKINMEIKMLEEYGEPFLRAAEQIGLTKRDINALGSGLSEDARAEVKRGVVKIGDTEFKIEELGDNVEEFKSHIDLLCKQKELEQKEKKHLEKKLEGLDREHKKEVQAYEKEVADLRSKVVDPVVPAGFAEVFKSIERKSDEIFMLAAKLRFDEAHKDVEDEGHVRALYQSSLKLICNRFENCIKKLEDGLGVSLSV